MQQNHLFVIKRLSDDVIGLQWNIDFTKCQGTGRGETVRHIEHLHLTNFRENYQNVHCVEVKLIISLQIPAFPDLS